MAMQNNPLVRKLGAYVSLTPSELAILEGFYQHNQRFEAGNNLMHEGQTGQTAFILSRGWVNSYKVLRDGSRQIVNFHIPGDFLGLRNVLFRAADHNIEPVTQIEACPIGHRRLLAAFEASTRLATAVLWAASSDEAVVVERLVSLGRRDATERTAHFLLELGARLRLVGLGTKAGYDCPLSQYHLADALGLSAVHINRVLRQLREEGLLTFRQGKVVFDDLDRLIVIAGFDAAYLDFDGPMLD